MKKLWLIPVMIACVFAFSTESAHAQSELGAWCTSQDPGKTEWVSYPPYYSQCFVTEGSQVSIEEDLTIELHELFVNFGILNVAENVSLTNFGEMGTTMGGILDNFGAIVSYGPNTVCCGGTFNNFGIYTHSSNQGMGYPNYFSIWDGVFNNLGTFTNYEQIYLEEFGVFSNTGSLHNQSYIFNSGGTVDNRGTIQNEGLLLNRGVVENRGLFFNQMGFIFNDTAGTLSNYRCPGAIGVISAGHSNLLNMGTLTFVNGQDCT